MILLLFLILSQVRVVGINTTQAHRVATSVVSLCNANAIRLGLCLWALTSICKTPYAIVLISKFSILIGSSAPEKATRDTQLRALHSSHAVTLLSFKGMVSSDDPYVCFLLTEHKVIWAGSQGSGRRSPWMQTIPWPDTR